MYCHCPPVVWFIVACSFVCLFVCLFFVCLLFRDLTPLHTSHAASTSRHQPPRRTCASGTCPCRCGHGALRSAQRRSTLLQCQCPLASSPLPRQMCAKGTALPLAARPQGLLDVLGVQPLARRRLSQVRWMGDARDAEPWPEWLCAAVLAEHVAEWLYVALCVALG